MHIAILITNTDESDFAQQRPDDGEKFRHLLSALRPSWQFSDFIVKNGVFPASIDSFDGMIISGSPASVHDDAPWVEQLLQLLRTAYSQGVPLYGACFGHQAIAKALGGTVDANPGGWVFGRVDTQLHYPWDHSAYNLSLYAAHTEQVTELPPAAKVTGSTPGCDIASFAIDNNIWTTQYHPEMTHEFIGDLLDEYESKLPVGVVATARQSLERKADTEAISAAIVSFFEQAAE